MSSTLTGTRPQHGRRFLAAATDYRDVFEYANDIMVVHDEVTGFIVEANRKACETYGHSLEVLRTMEVGDLTRNDERYNTGEGLRKIHEAVASRAAVIFDWIIRDGAGNEVPVEVNLKRINIGGCYRVLAIARDISERQRAEARLKERERYYRTLIENSSDGTAILQPDGRIDFIGPSIATMLGVPERFVRGRCVFDLLAPEDVPAVRALLASNDPEAGTVTYRVRHASGEWRIHEASCKHLLDDSAIKGQLINFRDITDRVRAQNAIREREQQLSRASRVSTTGEMAAALAHELNQPLFAIVNFLAGCTRRIKFGDAAPDELLVALGLAQHEAERAGKIIRALRGFVSNREFERQLFDVQALITDIAAYFGPS